MNNTDARKHQTISEPFPAINSIFAILGHTATPSHGSNVSCTHLHVQHPQPPNQQLSHKDISHLFDKNPHVFQLRSIKGGLFMRL